MLTSQQQVQQVQQEQQEQQEQQVLQQEQQVLQLQQQELGQQQELEQQQELGQQQELQQVFRHKRSRQELTGQQQEQRVSLSIPREFKLKSTKYLPDFKCIQNKKPEYAQNQRRRILALGYRKSSGFATFFAINPILWWMPTAVKLSTFP